MIARRSLALFPVLGKVAFAEFSAYRVEIVVAFLGGISVPLVMLAIWSASAGQGEVGRYSAGGFAAYFLSTFIVQQVTSSAIATRMDAEIREGTLAARLLRPFPPLLGYVLEGAAVMPLRALLTLPVVGLLLFLAPGQLSRSPLVWLAVLPAILGAWLIAVLINLAVGCLAFHVERSSAILHAYMALYFVFSGYMVPIDLLPPAVRHAVELLPFRYQVGLPVEMLTRGFDGDPGRLAACLARQWSIVVVLAFAVAALWRRGLRRFEAHGG